MFETQPAPKQRACTSAFQAGTGQRALPHRHGYSAVAALPAVASGGATGYEAQGGSPLRLLAEGLIALNTAGSLLLEGRRGSLHLFVTIHNDKSTARKKKKIGENNVFFFPLSLIFPVPPTDRTEWDSC